MNKRKDFTTADDQPTAEARPLRTKKVNQKYGENVYYDFDMLKDRGGNGHYTENIKTLPSGNGTSPDENNLNSDGMNKLKDTFKHEWYNFCSSNFSIFHDFIILRGPGN